jgi:hypothetical protein
MKSKQSCDTDNNMDNLLPKFLLTDINDKDDRWSLKQLKDDDPIVCEDEVEEGEPTYNLQAFEGQQEVIQLFFI